MTYCYPKIDLHLHLDGSMPLPIAYTLAKERNLTSKSFAEFSKTMRVKEDCHSLQDYLSCFDTPLAILQDCEALYKTCRALIFELHKQHLLYAEIRFAPQMHTRGDETQEDIIRAVLKAYHDIEAEIAPMKVRFILCMMTLGEANITHDANIETLHLAKKYLGQGIVAVDMAGAEGITELENFRYLFTLAKELQLPYTVHAGESCGYENVRTAISFQTKRIGHGRSSIESNDLMDELKKTQLPLELCATSNIHCQVVSSIRKHPIRKLYDYGINVTINTDNMTISNTTLDKEYDVLRTQLGFQDIDFININRNALLVSFLEDDEKQALLQTYDKQTKGFV